MQTTNPQLSPNLLRELSQKPFIIRGDAKSLLIYKRYLDLIIHLGELEHTGDWDLHLKVTLNNKQSFETTTGYPEIELGDFNSEDEPNALNLQEELTSIGFYQQEDEDDATITWYPLSDIKSIQVFE